MIWKWMIRHQHSCLITGHFLFFLILNRVVNLVSIGILGPQMKNSKGSNSSLRVCILYITGKLSRGYCQCPIWFIQLGLQWFNIYPIRHLQFWTGSFIVYQVKNSPTIWPRMTREQFEIYFAWFTGNFNFLWQLYRAFIIVTLLGVFFFSFISSLPLSKRIDSNSAKSFILYLIIKYRLWGSHSFVMALDHFKKCMTSA